MYYAGWLCRGLIIGKALTRDKTHLEKPKWQKTCTFITHSMKRSYLAHSKFWEIHLYYTISSNRLPVLFIWNFLLIRILICVARFEIGVLKRFHTTRFSWTSAMLCRIYRGRDLRFHITRLSINYRPPRKRGFH